MYRALTEEVEVPLLLRLLEDVLLDRAGRDESVDVDLPRLPDAVRSVLDNQQHQQHQCKADGVTSIGRSSDVYSSVAAAESTRR